MKRKIHIGDRTLGDGRPTYLVAEIATNHDQRLDEAMRLVGAAKRAGADAVKVDSRTPDEWLADLDELARDLELDLFAHLESANRDDAGASLQAPIYEVAATDTEVIRGAAAQGAPLLISVDDHTRDEVLGEALDLARDSGCSEPALLWRPGECPATAESLHLRIIQRFRQSFDVAVGFGDHTLGHAAAVAAVALGAVIVTKHLTLSRALPVAESAMSLEPEEFGDLVTAIRTAEVALGAPVDIETADAETTDAETGD